MALGAWVASALILPDTDESDFPHWAPPATIHADTNGGTVEIQRRNAAGDGWVTFETLTEPTSKSIQLKNMPAIRVNPTGSAEFMVVWSRHGS